MLVFRVVIRNGRNEVGYDFRRLDRPGWWSAWKDGAADPYLVNLRAKTCTCAAGRHGRKCKHRAQAETLEAQLMSATNGKPEKPGTAVAVAPPAEERDTALARVLIQGDLSALSEGEKASYYMAVCEATGLNPASQPFGYIKTKNGLKLYANKAAAQQLAKRDRVSLRIVSQGAADGLYVVTVEAATPDGRADADIGAVALGSLTGEDRANAIMKAVTKAKRRALLSICGLGMLDESEADSVARAEARAEAAATEPDKAPVGRVVPATALPPPPPPAPPARPAFDRVRAQSRVDELALELGLGQKFNEGLQKAYGKPTLQSLLDAELADLLARLERKKEERGQPKKQPAA
jgi:hypothetical protein